MNLGTTESLDMTLRQKKKKEQINWIIKVKNFCLSNDIMSENEKVVHGTGEYICKRTSDK